MSGHFFLLSFVSPIWSLLSSTSISFGGDVKPLVPVDLTRLAFGYFRPSVATSIVVYKPNKQTIIIIFMEVCVQMHLWYIVIVGTLVLVLILSFLHFVLSLYTNP